MMNSIKGITFDFYETLIHSRDGKGRGDLYQEYLEEQGLGAAPWEHQVLYDIFEYYGEAYDPELSDEDKALFWEEFTRRLFKRTCVSGCNPDEVRKHVGTMRYIFGPGHFELYPEVPALLNSLRKRGFLLGVISNWQKGLVHFCAELQILNHFETVISSAEIGIEKPDRRIFDIATRRLRLAPEFILHVGDHEVEDIDGANAAGFQSVLLCRKGGPVTRDAISDLTEIDSLVR